MTDLADRECETGASRLDDERVAELSAQLGSGWSVSGGKLTKTFAFDDFVTALAYVNRVGALAEEQNHHPDIELSWGKVGLTIWTHDAGALTENDFIWCAKAERLNART